jgi:hypothetical protein
VGIGRDGVGDAGEVVADKPLDRLLITGRARGLEQADEKIAGCGFQDWLSVG